MNIGNKITYYLFKPTNNKRLEYFFIRCFHPETNEKNWVIGYNNKNDKITIINYDLADDLKRELEQEFKKIMKVFSNKNIYKKILEIYIPFICLFQIIFLRNLFIIHHLSLLSSLLTILSISYTLYMIYKFNKKIKFLKKFYILNFLEHENLLSTT